MLIFNNNTSFEGLKHISPAHTFLKKKKKKKSICFSLSLFGIKLRGTMHLLLHLRCLAFSVVFPWLMKTYLRVLNPCRHVFSDLLFLWVFPKW